MNMADGRDLLLAVVDDDDLYRDYITTILTSEGKFRVLGAKSGVDAIDMLRNTPVDCILLDYQMGVENGLSIAGLIRKRYGDPPPIVMLTGEGKERTAVKAFRGGFSDYISKRNLNLNELVSVIHDAVDRKLSDRIEKVEQSRLARLSNLDSLTGLHASHFMKQRGEEMTASALRRNAACGLIVIRVQGLDGIGDEFGFVVRDRALRAFGMRLQKATLASDISGRSGDDHFLYLIDREARRQAMIDLCENLSRELSFEANFDGISLTLAPHIGAALLPLDGGTVDQLQAAAELAIALAQSRGISFASTWPPPEANHGDGSGAALAAQASFDEPDSSTGERRKTDRRTERRQRVLKRGQIFVRGFSSVVSCIVRDITSKGARLRLDDYFSPPDQFDLLLIDSGIKHAVRLRWHIGNDMGVQFLD